MDTKPWYLSVTVWGIMLAGLAQVLQIAGVNFDVSGMSNDIVTLLTAGLALYGRLRAKTVLTAK